MSEFLEFVGVSKRFGPVKAVNNVSFSVKRGEFFSLLGPSGCGKTTLLRMLAGFEQPDEGRILLGGRDITHLPPDRRQVNTVFQNYALFPHLTLWDNIAFGLRLRRLPKDEIAARVEEMPDDGRCLAERERAAERGGERDGAAAGPREAGFRDAQRREDAQGVRDAEQREREQRAGRGEGEGNRHRGVGKGGVPGGLDRDERFESVQEAPDLDLPPGGRADAEREHRGVRDEDRERAPRGDRGAPRRFGNEGADEAFHFRGVPDVVPRRGGVETPPRRGERGHSSSSSGPMMPPQKNRGS